MAGRFTFAESAFGRALFSSVRLRSTFIGAIICPAQIKSYGAWAERIDSMSDLKAEILDLYRQLSPEKKNEFIHLLQELPLTKPKETSAGQMSSAQQD